MNVPYGTNGTLMCTIHQTTFSPTDKQCYYCRKENPRTLAEQLGAEPVSQPPKKPKRSASAPDSPPPAPTAACTVWEQYENRHDEYPMRERNDAVQFDKWWVLRMTARHAESEIRGAGKVWWDTAADYMRRNYKEKSSYAPGEREKRVVLDCAHDLHTTSGKSMGRGYAHFFDEAAKLANCTLPDPYEKRARQVRIEREKQERERRFEEDRT
jgi:hypothetical protein